MTALLSPNPQIIKPLYGTGNYLFSLPKFPELTFFVQECELPGITGGVETMNTSVHDFPLPGETMTFDNLTCTFLVDAKLQNYRAISDWIVGLCYPEGHQMFAKLMLSDKNRNSASEFSKTVTDGNLTILDNSNNQLVSAIFVDCFPISLGPLRFGSTNNDSAPISCQVTFAYSYFHLQ